MNWAHLLHVRNWISKSIYQFSTQEMCCLLAFALRSRDTFWHPCTTSGADRWDENSKVWIRVDTPTCWQTRCTSEPGWTHQSVWISTETRWNRWVGPRESNLRYRQCNKYKPKKRQCVPNMTASELPREVRENTHQSWEDSVVPVCVFFIASFFIIIFILF